MKQRTSDVLADTDDVLASTRKTLDDIEAAAVVRWLEGVYEQSYAQTQAEHGDDFYYVRYHVRQHYLAAGWVNNLVEDGDEQHMSAYMRCMAEVINDNQYVDNPDHWLIGDAACWPTPRLCHNITEYPQIPMRPFADLIENG